MPDKIYDLLIIGTGAAGYTASLYASRYDLTNLVIGSLPGGLASSAFSVCNYPTEWEISGIDLMNKMLETTKKAGGEVVFNQVVKLEKNEKLFSITTATGEIYFGKSLIIATGTKHRHLGLANEERFLGRGVAYCATCDGMFFKNKTVAVIGGGDAANTASLYLSKICNQVYQIHRGDKLSGETAWIKQISKDPKVKIIFKTNVKDILGNIKVEKIVLDNPYQGSNELAVDGVFIEIGSSPDVSLFKDLGLETNEKGFIKVNLDQSTNIEGVFSAGDITNLPFKQIITACGQGAIAADSVNKYLKTKLNI